MADVDSKIALSIAATFFEYSNRCRRADVAQCGQHTEQGAAKTEGSELCIINNTPTNRIISHCSKELVIHVKRMLHLY